VCIFSFFHYQENSTRLNSFSEAYPAGSSYLAFRVTSHIISSTATAKTVARVETRSKIWIITVLEHLRLHFFFRGSTALGSRSLLTAEASRLHLDTPQSEGLLWTIDQPVAERHNNHKTQESMPPLTGIRTRNPSKRTKRSVFKTQAIWYTPVH
jgi:hypothetical protein